MAPTREIRDRQEIERIWKLVNGPRFETEGCFPANDIHPEGTTEDIFTERFKSIGRGVYVIHYTLPLDEETGFEEPDLEYIDWIEESPGYTMNLSHLNVIHIKSTWGDEWEVPIEEESMGIWDAIDAYDVKHGTSLWDDIDERLYAIAEEYR